MKNVLADAVVFATLTHEDQFRKNEVNGIKIPYIFHCHDVVKTLIGAGVKDEEVLAAAELHDTIEESIEVNYEVLKNKFGQRVADIVQELTYIPKEGGETKEEYLLSFENKSIESCIIKAADRFCNTMDFYHCEKTEKYASKYFHKADELFKIIFKRFEEIDVDVRENLKTEYYHIKFALDG